MHSFDIKSLTSNKWNLGWAYDNYSRDGVIKNFSYSTKGEYVFISSDVFQYGRYFVPTITVGPRGINARCQCSYNTNRDLCAHTLATLIMYEEVMLMTGASEFSEDDYTKYRMREQLKAERQEEERQRVQARKQGITLGKKIVSSFNHMTNNEIDNIINKELYHLEFEVDIDEEAYQFTGDDYYRIHDYSIITVAAKIGAEKMYVLKDITQFLDNVDDNISHKYGKFLEFKHTLSAFEPEVQKLIPVMSDYVNSKDQREYNDRYLSFKREDIHEFYEMFKDYPQAYLDITLDEKDYDVHFNVEKEDYYSVSLNNKSNIQISHDQLYELSHDRVRKLSIEDERLKHLVVNILKNETVLFEHDDLQNIFNVFDKEAYTITGFTVLERKDVDVSLYLDLESDDIVVHGHYFKGEEKIELDHFSEESYTLNQILYILNSFKTSWDKNKVTMSLRDDKTYRFLEEGLSLLEGLCTVYADESLRNIERPTSLNLSVGVGLENNLLELKVESIQMSKDDIFNVLMEYRRKKKYYKLQSGEIVNLDSKDMREFDEFATNMGIDPKELKADVVRIPLYRALQVESLSSMSETIKFDMNQELKTFNENFNKYSIDSIMIDQHSAILKDYQKHGVKWLMLMKKYGFNGILADDMGLGKTLQVIAMLENTKSDKPSIVICPASLLFNWEDELNKFNSDLSYICIHGPKATRDKLIKRSGTKDLIITTYDYLRSDHEQYENFEYENIIIDEAQYIKNQKTLTAKAVKTLDGKSRIALTGTPIENNLSELWSIFDFLMPGYLYSYTHFRRFFETPIVKDNNEDKQKQLRAMVEPFILRRVKKDVLLDLPDKIEKTLRVEFSEAEEELYTAKLVQGNKEVQAILGEDRIDNIEILKLLGELRQICCDPRMIYPEFPHVSSKVKACIELVTPMVQSKQKVLIFSSFVKTLDLLEIEMRKRNIKYHMLTGSNTKEERKELVNKFQKDDSTVFLISLKAAGVGLNLTAAENVIHFDPWWNVAAENQASDRAHRIGQKNTVSVFKLIMKNSIEEKILKMQERKQDMADIFVQGASGSFASLSKDDILDLFKQ